MSLRRAVMPGAKFSCEWNRPASGRRYAPSGGLLVVEVELELAERGTARRPLELLLEDRFRRDGRGLHEARVGVVHQPEEVVGGVGVRERLLLCDGSVPEHA